MSSAVALLRPAIRGLQAYRPADYVPGFVRLNANEAPWRPPGDESREGLNRYPDPRPAELTRRMATHYGVAPEALVVTRGSSEAIDLLIRGFCEAGRDEIIICPPTFGMYEVYARIQGAAVRTVPLLRDQGYALDVDGILASWSTTTRLVFVCSPNNPTGNAFPEAEIRRLCTSLAGRGVVALDAAYADFCAEDRMHALLGLGENLVVLRTLSKALGLAGVRCGALIGPPDLVELLGRILPPYCFPTTSQDAVLRCLQPDSGTELESRRQTLLAERRRLLAALPGIAGIRQVWPSETNFLLVEAEPGSGLAERARQGGVLVRDFSWDPLLPNCVRITVGSPTENDQLLQALAN